MQNPTDLSRRKLLKTAVISSALSAALGGLHPAIARALEIEAKRNTGTIKDVEHVVILTQENRSFDHYFGTLNGVRGFGDRFVIPAPDLKARKKQTIFVQPNEHDDTALIAPYHLNTLQDFKHMRVEGTPHTFPDAQAAWDDGRLSDWTKAKHNHSLGYFKREDIPFQFALAEAFTLCDAYHCSIQSSTNPNRTYLWTGTNNALGDKGGPVIDNGYDTLGGDPKGHEGYDWVTYPERLQAAGITWQVYQDMKNNFTDNALVGFKTFRAADKAKTGPLVDLANRSIRTRDLDKLREDVLAGTLPSVSWIVAGGTDSEHPEASSPAQGADFTARVLEALTANPEVWAKTVFFVNYDENDGFFDHVAPPAPPSRLGDKTTPSDSQIDTTGEYHLLDDRFKNHSYGLGSRVPMFVISPWSRGGYVASEVFDHTSVIRFLETRFGVMEPNISAWRRAVCGDLTSCFDFSTPNQKAFFEHLPKTKALADKAHALFGRTTPKTPKSLIAPVQEHGQRPRRATPYDLSFEIIEDKNGLNLRFHNQSLDRACVFQLYDVLDLNQAPRRFTVAAKSSMDCLYPSTKDAPYEFVVSGPNGFWVHVKARFGALKMGISVQETNLSLDKIGYSGLDFTLKDEAYGQKPRTVSLKDYPVNDPYLVQIPVEPHSNWYDFTIKLEGVYMRFAGHIEDGKSSFSDPAAHGSSKLNWD